MIDTISVMKHFKLKSDPFGKCAGDEVFRGKRDVQGIGDRSASVTSKLYSVLSSLQSSWDKPTEAQMTYFKQAEKALTEALAKFNKVFSEDVPVFKNKVKEADIKLFPGTGPLDINWKPGKKQ